ncbi:MAG: GNAT family N-acetyltransferase [Chloroflexia bacterium]|nr:GNAT family N-acetyltransferase [Chloroflexia bacterium]
MSGSPSPIIRRAEPEDAAIILRWRLEPSTSHFQPLRPRTVDELRTRLQQRRSEPLDTTLDSEVQWTILDNGIPAGWVRLEVTSREHRVGSVGYTVATAHRGRGLATAALHEVARLALDPHGLDLWRLEANVASANLASRRVLAKAGFVHEGHARGLVVIAGARVDHERYALLRSDLFSHD